MKLGMPCKTLRTTSPWKLDLLGKHSPGAGVILFGSSFLLAILTLPVEFNASARAQELLVSHGIIRGDEQITGVQKVLGAAAWTYVAAAVGVWLFYLFVLFFRGSSAQGNR